MLDDLPIDTPDKERVLMVVNAYLINKGVKFVGDVPEPIKQAGLELTHAFMNGELLAGRTEGVVTSKSSKAGDVSVSKTYADGEQGQAMSQNEQIALALIEPYLQQPLGMFGLPLVRV